HWSPGVGGPITGKGFVLNAFRHHWNTHMVVRSLSSGCFRAQRLSASLEYSHGVTVDYQLGFKCSTPFGIIGILTVPRIKLRCLGFMCSTPFGIIGILTGTATAVTFQFKSAQRLSASLNR